MNPTWSFHLSSIIFLLLCLVCMADETIDVQQLSEDWVFSPHIHLRLRYDVQDNGCKDPGGTTPKYSSPHSSRFLDYRTKLWLDIMNKPDDFDGRIMIANRMEYFFSDWETPKNHSPAHHSAPDVLSLMEAWCRFSIASIDGLKIKLGRQPFTMGNGMVVHDGQPYGWHNYYDGIMLSFAHGQSVTRAFAFYNYWRDPLCVDLAWEKADYVSGKGYALTQGNNLMLGVDEVCAFSDPIKVEGYYIFDNVEADDFGRLERRMPNDWDRVNMHTFGLRLFGECVPWLAHSIETAHQVGQWFKNGDDGTLTGSMVDMRLDLKLDKLWNKSTPLAPVWRVSYTYWSGDDSNTGRYEGWFPLHGYYTALFDGEEVSNKGGVPCGALWTNLHAFHTDLKFNVCEDCTVNFGSTYYMADKAANYGKNIGMTLYGRIQYQLTKAISLKLVLSEMFFGDYYGPSRHRCGFWGRFEINFLL